VVLAKVGKAPISVSNSLSKVLQQGAKIAQKDWQLKRAGESGQELSNIISTRHRALERVPAGTGYLAQT